MTSQEEQDKVFKYILNKIVFSNFHSYEENQVMNGIELILTPECNQACKYCYLNNYGDKLYPKNLRDHNTILQNIDKLLDFVQEKKLYFPSLFLFSGEIWGSQFGLQVFELLLRRYKDYKFSRIIAIPSNMSFLRSTEATQKIEMYMAEFETYGCHVHWSASIEGQLIEDKFRPFKDCSKHDDEFYDTVFKFAKKYHIGFHPMVSSKSCQYWPDNYDWFIDKFQEYGINRTDPMMLEVRNDDWTEEDIQYYCAFLDHLYAKKKECAPDIRTLTHYIMRYGEYPSSKYSPLSLHDWGNKFTCSLQSILHVRMGDLAIVPCHRTSYEQFLLGYFTTDETGKINGITSKNAELALYTFTANPNLNHPICEKCVYNKLCNKGCLGAQFEASGDLTLPCKSVCEFQKRRLDHLIDLYDKEGILEQMKKDTSNYPMLETTVEQINIIQDWRKSNERAKTGNI